MKIAVIKTGGKQYKVAEKTVLKIEKLEANIGDTVKFDTLLVATEDAKEFNLGTPSLGENVTAKVLDHGKGKKVTVMKTKNKTRYKKVTGHRQPFTKVEIEKIA